AIALAQMERDRAQAESRTKPTSDGDGGGAGQVKYPNIGTGEVRVVSGPSSGAPAVVPGQGSVVTVVSPSSARPKRFFGSVGVDPQRLARDVSTIATELVAHLTALPGAQAEIQLDITIRVPGGVPDNVVRTVTEN